MADHAEIARRFTYHPPDDARAELHAEVRAEFSRLAHYLAGVLPDCPEAGRTIDRLDEAMMLANAAIARPPP